MNSEFQQEQKRVDSVMETINGANQQIGGRNFPASERSGYISANTFGMKSR